VKDAETTSKHLARILDLTEKEAYDYVTKNQSSVAIHPKGRKISSEQEKELLQLNMSGVYLAKDSKRYYPNDNYLGHVLGFTGTDNQALIGLEKRYAVRLAVASRSSTDFSDAKGKKLSNSSNVYPAPKDGLQLKTTFELNVKTIMDRELNLAE